MKVINLYTQQLCIITRTLGRVPVSWQSLDGFKEPKSVIRSLIPKIDLFNEFCLVLHVVIAIVEVSLERRNKDLIQLNICESWLILLLLNLKSELALLDDVEMSAVISLLKEEIASLVSEVLEAPCK